MDYSLDGLSDRQFERLSQVLAYKVIGPQLSVFGDGPDGGREATWVGPGPSLDGKSEWDGYGVLQAKKCEHPSTRPVDNETWFRDAIKKELNDWAKAASKRGQKPEYLILSTNVRLSPYPGAGIDRVNAGIQALIDELHLPIKGFKVWHYDEIQVMLDADPAVYSRFAAWITPGDVIARLVQDGLESEQRFTQALRAHAAQSFMDDNYLNLTQAGTVSDKAVSVSDVFIDLPHEPGQWTGPEHRILGRSMGDQGPSHKREEQPLGIAEALIKEANESDPGRAGSGEPAGLNRSVLVGGPGQGKSTITQFLAQVYRAEFVRDTPSADDAELRKALQSLDRRMQTLGIERPAARRWPIRVILTDLADALERKECVNLLEFMANLIQRRAGSSLSTDSLRLWLGSYPWIVLIDGLDEVPSSSNRADVMRAIKDFYIEVATVQGDVSTVATTRPQGYNNEFSPEHYRHFVLSDLPYETAMEYAESLIGIRSGTGTEASRRTRARLERATQEEATAHLFASPLQVTILTVLIERLGQAPRDRWRLFSDYYRVIYQREQEKGGDLARLLQDHQSDVNYIHRHVGHLLQERSAVAGATSSFISKKDLEVIIRERLDALGHEAVDVERLTNEFSRLIVERLVFLALLSAERVGFELRSFQEFMAAEYIISRPENEVLAMIKDIAPNSHWSNVVLFAFGQIFAEKDHLKGDAVQVFEQLNWDLEYSAILMVGSELALDVLLDGSCYAQPVYARPIAERAALLFDGPLTGRIGEFGRLKEGQVGRIFRTKAMSPAPQSISAQLNRLRYLSLLADADDTEASDRLISMCAGLDGRAREAAAELALNHDDMALLNALEPLIDSMDPALVLNDERFDVLVDPDDDSEGDLPPRWRAIQRFRALARTRQGIFRAEASTFSFLAYGLTAGASEWQAVSAFPTSSAAWTTVAKVAEFMENPSEETFASVLELAASLENAEVLKLAPWPLAACYASASNYASSTGHRSSARTWLTHLAELARGGALGNVETWKRAEEAWEFSTPLLKDVLLERTELPRAEHPNWTIPVGRDPDVLSASLTGRFILSEPPKSQSDLDDLVTLCCDVLAGLEDEEPGDNSLARFSLGLFLAQLAVMTKEPRWNERIAGEAKGSEMEIGAERELRDAILSAARGAERLHGRDPAHLGWAPLFRDFGNDEGTIEVVKAFGGLRCLRNYYGAIEYEPGWLLDMRFGAEDWKRLRFLAHVNVGALLSIEKDTLQGVHDQLNESGVQQTFAAFLRICLASPSDLDSGLRDQDIARLCGVEDRVSGTQVWELDTVNETLLHRLVLESQNRFGVSLAAKCSEVVAPHNPAWGMSFAELAGLVGEQVRMEPE